MITNKQNKDIFIRYLNALRARGNCPYVYYGGVIINLDKARSHTDTAGPIYSYFLQHLDRTVHYLIDFEFGCCDLTATYYQWPNLILNAVSIDELLDYLDKNVLGGAEN